MPDSSRTSAPGLKPIQAGCAWVWWWLRNPQALAFSLYIGILLVFCVLIFVCCLFLFIGGPGVRMDTWAPFGKELLGHLGWQGGPGTPCLIARRRSIGWFSKQNKNSTTALFQGRSKETDQGLCDGKCTWLPNSIILLCARLVSHFTS